jgi:Na+-transporting NADH:ubiquinone oxidoreductase subunit NqrC
MNAGIGMDTAHIEKITQSEIEKRVITRKGEKYVYMGDITNTKQARENARESVKVNGRKSIFVVDPHNKKTAIHYVSDKFYKHLHLGIYPSYGQGNLLKE